MMQHMAQVTETDVQDDPLVETLHKQHKPHKLVVPWTVPLPLDAGARQSQILSATCECQRSQCQAEPVKDQQLLMLSHRLPSLKLATLFDD
jgi:hypothetical protein